MPLINLAIYLPVNKMTSPLIGIANCTPLADPRYRAEGNFDGGKFDELLS